MFGKEATETMWVTESEENDHYTIRAESHGSIYVSRLSLVEAAGTTTLTMSFSGEARSFIARVLSTLMGPFIKGSMQKELQKDLAEIKKHLEEG